MTERTDQHEHAEAGKMEMNFPTHKDPEVQADMEIVWSLMDDSMREWFNEQMGLYKGLPVAQDVFIRSAITEFKALPAFAAAKAAMSRQFELPEGVSSVRNPHPVSNRVGMDFALPEGFDEESQRARAQLRKIWDALDNQGRTTFNREMADLGGPEEQVDFIRSLAAGNATDVLKNLK